MPDKKSGIVYLIGAGPGDAGLITKKGFDLLNQADVIIYDHLVNPALLKEAKKEAELIYVGKKSNRHTLPQSGINKLLVKKAKKNRIVLRLKGGDPFVYGRGGEEALYLRQNKIAFEIVPGVTSAIAAAAYAGIPLTHRDLAASLSIITGHRKKGEDVPIIDSDTLVYLMGISNISNIVGGLLKKGKDPKTPVAVIRWGTTAKQKTVVSSLKSIVSVVKKEKIAPPAIIVIGKVVSLRKDLSWFEKRPLFGKRIAVTRSREEASVLSGKLTALGADVREIPSIEAVPILENPLLDKAVHWLSAYKYIVFTSKLGVRCFFDRLYSLGLDARNLSGIKTYCIGPATAEELRKNGIKSDYYPKEYKAESLAAGFPDSLDGVKILIPRAENAREVLPVELKKRGAIVEVIPVYKIVKPKAGNIDLQDIDIVTFASSQTVLNFLDAIGKKNKKNLKGIKIACIGPITAKTAKDNGLKVSVLAKEYTMDGLVRAILKGKK